MTCSEMTRECSLPALHSNESECRGEKEKSLCQERMGLLFFLLLLLLFSSLTGTTIASSSRLVCVHSTTGRGERVV